MGVLALAGALGAISVDTQQARRQSAVHIKQDITEIIDSS